MHDHPPTAYGIEALNVYAGIAAISAAAVFEGRGLDPERFGNVMMAKRTVGLPFEDPVTNAVNAAKPIVDALTPEGRGRIELVLTCSESAIDYSKSIASYVLDHLGLGPQCRLLELKQACYSATAALQLAVAYAASGVSPGAKALVIATDVCVADERAEYAEPATGAGAVAMLVGDDPRVLAVDLGAFGNHSFETLDSARPAPDTDIADVDQSLLAYLECLVRSFDDYCSRVDGVDFVETFDYLAFHTPFAGMVKAAHRRISREARTAAPADIDADFERRMTPSLVYPSEVGNIFSGSLYLALASLIDTVQPKEPARVGLFSYGSGCSSEFFSGLIDAESAAALAGMGLRAHLDSRVELGFADYVELLPDTRACLLPVRDRKVPIDRYARLLDQAGRGGGGEAPLLVLEEVREYHRRYRWV